LDLLWGRCRHTRGPPGAGPRRQPAVPGTAAGRRTTRAGRGPRCRPPSAVTGYREGPSHALPGRKFGSGVDHGPTVFRREGRFVPGMDSYQPFSAMGQNLAPGTLRRGSGSGVRTGSRTLGGVSRRAGFRAGWRFRSLSGQLHTRGPPGAGPRRRPPGGAGLPCVAAVSHGQLHTYSSKGEAALLLGRLG
jgi:hypothetical protein